MTWLRPIPLIGDVTSAAERAQDPAGWAFPEAERDVLQRAIAARRDVRRYRPDAVPEHVLDRVLSAAHAAPSVGQSQPWRFVIIDDPAVRDRAAWMADRARLAQAAELEPDAARHLLDLQLEGIREAPLGVVVCCDRRVAPAAVLGRATFQDADIWSCICAIQNLWLAARVEGLGVGWVTLFNRHELDRLVGAPAGVETLGWLCLGWPDERPPEPGLQRAGWSQRAPLEAVVVRNRWPADMPPPPPTAKPLRGPLAASVVRARDGNDELLTVAGSLGVLDRAIDRALAVRPAGFHRGVLVLAAGRHPVTALGVSAFADSVTDEVLEAARAGEALGAVAAGVAGLELIILDGGASTGNLRDEPAITSATTAALVDRGRAIAEGAGDLVVVGEVGVGNTTVAAALAGQLLGLGADAVVGLGASADSATVSRKRHVVAEALARCARDHGGTGGTDPLHALACLGGPEFALLAGVILGATAAGSVVVLDGLATSVAALVAARMEPAVTAHLVAGQRSRETAHPAVLAELGLEPLLDLRFRAGEGVGAALAARLLLDGLRIRRTAGRTAP